MSLRIGALSDIHWSLDPLRSGHWHNAFDFAGVETRARLALEKLVDEEIDLLVLLGDLADEGDSPSLDAFLGLCRSLWRGPLVIVPGNHDVMEDHSRIAPSLEHAPDDRTIGGWRIETVGITPTGAGRFTAVVERQALAPGAPTVVLSHFPLFSQAGLFEQHLLKYAGDLVATERVARGLEERTTPTIVLCGHLHARSTRVAGRVLQLGLGSLIEPPHEYSIIELLESANAWRATRRAIQVSTDSLDHPALAPSHEQWCLHGAREPWSRAD